MSRLTLKDLFDTLKDWHTEQTAFVEKYSEHIEVLKRATALANAQKKSWFNEHKWLIVTIAVLVGVFALPLVMKKNNICQLNINFNEGLGVTTCRQETIPKN